MLTTLTRRILLPFAVVAGVVVAVLLALQLVSEKVEAAHEVEWRLLSIQLQLREIAAQVQGGILTGEERFAVGAARSALEADRRMQGLTASHDAHGNLAALFEDYYAGMVALNSLFLENRVTEGTQQLNRMSGLQDRIDTLVGKLRAAAQRDLDWLAQVSMAAKLVSIVALLGAFFLVAALVVRSVVNPVKQLARAMEEIAGKAEQGLERQ